MTFPTDLMQFGPDADRQLLFEGVVSDRSWPRPGTFGLTTMYALGDCHREKLADPAVYARWLDVLLSPRGIDMTPHGEARIEEFGVGSLHGISFDQRITTSLVAGYEDRATGTLYVYVCSCKPYDPRRVDEVSREYFGTDGSRSTLDTFCLRAP